MRLEEMSAQPLAYLGDCVLELVVREHLVEKGLSTSAHLNAAALDYVRAPAQAEAMKRLTDHLTDEEAASIVKTEEGAGEGPRNYINIGIINEHFEAGDTVTLNILKEKGLIDKKIMRIKILADGILDRPLTVKAESFSIQAVKMIELTGGTVIVLK